MKENIKGYALLVGILIIIIIVLISYVAYNKGKSQNEETTTTSTTTTTMPKINKEYLHEEICPDDECNQEFANLDLGNGNFTMKIEATDNEGLVKHNLILSGSVNKTLSLGYLSSIKIIDSEYALITYSKEKDEEKIIELYNNLFNKLDELLINSLKKVEYNGFELTYYTFDEACPDAKGNYFYKNKTQITNNGFKIISSIKDEEKIEGITC